MSTIVHRSLNLVNGDPISRNPVDSGDASVEDRREAQGLALPSCAATIPKLSASARTVNNVRQF
jgi:hypothetical protein